MASSAERPADTSNPGVNVTTARPPNRYREFIRVMESQAGAMAGVGLYAEANRAYALAGVLRLKGSYFWDTKAREWRPLWQEGDPEL